MKEIPEGVGLILVDKDGTSWVSLESYSRLRKENEGLIKERIAIGKLVADIQIILLKKALEGK